MEEISWKGKQRQSMDFFVDKGQGQNRGPSGKTDTLTLTLTLIFSCDDEVQVEEVFLRK
jgi:hypothetical protein